MILLVLFAIAGLFMIVYAASTVAIGAAAMILMFGDLILCGCATYIGVKLMYKLTKRH